MNVRNEAISAIRDLARSHLVDAAMSLCHEALKVAEDDAALECLRARLLLGLRAYPEAIAAASRALELDPTCLPAHLCLGLAYDRQGGMADRSLLVWTEMAERAPQVAQVHVQLGEALWAAGHTSDAVAAFEQALSVDSSCTRASHELAIVALQREGMATALPQFRRAAELDPSQDRLFFALCGFDLSGTLPAAVADVPPDRGSRLAAAGTYALLEKYIPAADLVRAILAEDPDDAETLALAGYCYLKQEALNESIACSLRALAVKPRTPAAVLVLGSAFACRPALASNAVRVFGALAKAVPTHALPHVLLAESLLGTQSYQAAGDAYRAALGIDRDNVRARIGLAAVLFTQGRHADAVWQMRLAGDSDLERREVFWSLFDAASEATADA